MSRDGLGSLWGVRFDLGPLFLALVGPKRQAEQLTAD